jgi:hypothetical protein
VYRRAPSWLAHFQNSALHFLNVSTAISKLEIPLEIRLDFGVFWRALYLHGSQHNTPRLSVALTRKNHDAVKHNNSRTAHIYGKP